MKLHHLRLIILALLTLSWRVPTLSAATAPNDSVYNASHPSILFTAEMKSSLAVRVDVTGEARDAFDYVDWLADEYYLVGGTSTVLSEFYGLNGIPNIGIAAHLRSPVDTVLMALGSRA